MPKVFKTLATISVWILFINAIGNPAWLIITFLTRPGGPSVEPYNFWDQSWWAIAVLSAFLAVVAVNIRKGLE
ncbi:MAG: hypothetical protein HYX81_04040 [Chloroflexi bacterium]|nr:hypothetical protein [Chloroflexota bacterium]